MKKKHSFNQTSYSFFSRVVQKISLSDSEISKKHTRLNSKLNRVSKNYLLDSIKTANIFHDLEILEELKKILIRSNQKSEWKNVLFLFIEAITSDLHGLYKEAFEKYNLLSAVIDEINISDTSTKKNLLNDIDIKRNSVIQRTSFVLDTIEKKSIDVSHINTEIQNSGYDFIHDCFRHDIMFDRAFNVFNGAGFLVPQIKGDEIKIIIENNLEKLELNYFLKLSILLRKQGEFKQAIELLETFSKELDSDYEIDIASINTATILKKDNQLDKAQLKFRGLIGKLLDSTDDSEVFLLGVSQNNLGLLLLSQHKIDEAIKLFKQSIHNFSKINDLHAVSLLINNLIFIELYHGKKVLTDEEILKNIDYIVDNKIFEELLLLSHFLKNPQFMKLIKGKKEKILPEIKNLESTYVSHFKAYHN